MAWRKLIRSHWTDLMKSVRWPCFAAVQPAGRASAAHASRSDGSGAERMTNERRGEEGESGGERENGATSNGTIHWKNASRQKKR